MTENKIEVAYSAARPEDARVPYEQLSKNKVEFGALDKRYQSQRNLNVHHRLHRGDGHGPVQPDGAQNRDGARGEAWAAG